MKIYTSYFYQIRFFTPNMIPLSTAMFQPKWYGTTPYQDKRGVWNGLTIPPFAPTETTPGSCQGRPCGNDIQSCMFLMEYRAQLHRLDFDNVMARIERLANYVKSQSNFKEEPIVVLMVWEKPDVPCCERPIIQEWFAEHGIEVKEWIP